MNISISFREAYAKKSSGNWLEFNFFEECERPLKCMKRSSVDFPSFFRVELTKIEQNCHTCLQGPVKQK